MQHTRAALRHRAQLDISDPQPDTGAAEPLDVFQAICRDLIEGVGCTRVSIWRFNPHADAIHCRCLYDQRGQQFPPDTVLTAAGVPLYFELMIKERLMVVPDYAQHPATRNLGAPYAQSTGIRALIDVLVTDDDGASLAIISAEQDRPRDWREADILALYQMAELVTPLFRKLGRLPG
jgi:GAF domain-containing protein